MSQEKPKQIIVMRKDLNMRKGKMVAQGAHASMAAILHVMRYDNIIKDEQLEYFVFKSQNKAVTEWINGQFTKVCVYVNSEQELIDIIEKAKAAGLINSLITDSGLTEFDGVPTITCGAVGPAYPSQLQSITGHLPLL